MYCVVDLGCPGHCSVHDIMTIGRLIGRLAVVWAGGGTINRHHLFPLVMHCLDVLGPPTADYQGIYLVMPAGGVESQTLRKPGLLESFV